MALPLAVVDILVHAHELARDRDHQPNGLLRDFDGVTSGGVANDQTIFFGGGEIHAVDADAGAGDDFDPFHFTDGIPRQRHRAVHDDAVGIFRHFDHVGLGDRAADSHVGVDFFQNRLE